MSWRALGLLFLFGTAARAQVTPFVPAGSAAYGNLDKLEALGCAYPTYRVLGPQAFSDLRASVDWDAQNTSCAAPEWLLDERQLLLRPSPAAEFSAVGFGAVDDFIPLNGISAGLWPTFAQREGRTSFNGFNIANELFISAHAGGQDWGYAVAVTPGFFLGYDVDTSLNGRFYVQEFQLKVGYGFAELIYGRYGRRFGNTRHGSVLFSAASAPLEVLELNLRPIVLGGFLSHLGPVSFRTYLGGQGSAAAVPSTRLWGVELGMRPFRWWEIGFTELFQFGGVGVPSLEVGEALQMLLAGGGSALANRRNAILALHTGFWAPDHFAKLYGQVLWDRVGDGVAANAPAWMAGLWFPKVGSWDFRLEVARSGQQTYTHPIWKQGLSLRGSPLGHPLGPDAEGAYFDIGLPPIATWWHSEVGLLYESRSRNPPPGQATENRYGVSLSTGRRWGLSDLGVTFAYHQVHGTQYLPGEIADVFGIGAQFRYTFFY